MKPTTVLGIPLAVLGISALVCRGFSKKRQEKVLGVGPIYATRDDTERVPLPPIVGGLALLGGAALPVIGPNEKA